MAYIGGLIVHIHNITQKLPQANTQGHETGLTPFRQIHDTPSQELGRFRRLSQKTVIFNNVVFQGVKKQHFLTPSSFNKRKSLPRHTGRGGFCAPGVRRLAGAFRFIVFCLKPSPFEAHEKNPRAQNPGFVCKSDARSLAPRFQDGNLCSRLHHPHSGCLHFNILSSV